MTIIQEFLQGFHKVFIQELVWRFPKKSRKSSRFFPDFTLRTFHGIFLKESIIFSNHGFFQRFVHFSRNLSKNSTENSLISQGFLQELLKTSPEDFPTIPPGNRPGSPSENFTIGIASMLFYQFFHKLLHRFHSRFLQRIPQRLFQEFW